MKLLLFIFLLANISVYFTLFLQIWFHKNSIPFPKAFGTPHFPVSLPKNTTMKFGKVSNPDTIDFSLPADPAVTTEVLSKLPSPVGTPTIYLGCTGWSMKEWVGNTYPADAKTKDYLTYYAKQFNTIELNTTHYRIPSPEMIDKWKTQSTGDFRFCPKIFQQISHARDLGIGSGALVRFCEAVAGLGKKLGPCFMQLPPYFGKDRYTQLEAFLKNWPPSIRLAVEVRHASWFETANDLTTLLQLLHAYKVGTVITDVSGRRDVLNMGITTTYAMVRWVGNGLIPSDYARIDEWVGRIKKWVDQGLHEVYFFLHEPDNILGPEITLYLTEKIKEQLPTAQTKGPQLPYPVSQGQLTMF